MLVMSHQSYPKNTIFRVEGVGIVSDSTSRLTRLLHDNNPDERGGQKLKIERSCLEQLILTVALNFFSNTTLCANTAAHFVFCFGAEEDDIWYGVFSCSKRQNARLYILENDIVGRKSLEGGGK